MKQYSVVYNQRYFAIVEDQLANCMGCKGFDFQIYPLYEWENWDRTIEKYQNMNKQYVVLDEDNFEMIVEYFG